MTCLTTCLTTIFVNWAPGSESSTLEIDVYVRRYALLVVLARNDDDDDISASKGCYPHIFTRTTE